MSDPVIFRISHDFNFVVVDPIMSPGCREDGVIERPPSEGVRGGSDLLNGLVTLRDPFALVCLCASTVTPHDLGTANKNIEPRQGVLH